jgi:hypothetical protein
MPTKKKTDNNNHDVDPDGHDHDGGTEIFEW